MTPPKPANLPKVRSIWEWGDGEHYIWCKVTAVRWEGREWWVHSRLTEGKEPYWCDLDEWLQNTRPPEECEIPL